MGIDCTYFYLLECIVTPNLWDVGEQGMSQYEQESRRVRVVGLGRVPKKCMGEPQARGTLVGARNGSAR